jgi:hypothetical protein
LTLVARLVVAAVVAALALAPGALALDCPNTPLEERLAAADAAFVGRVVAERPAASGNGLVYHFLVDQRVKGPVGREVDVLAAERLVDADDDPLVHDEALGVMAALAGAQMTTESCLLTDPGALLSASDEARGTWIKIVIGLGILGVVVWYSIRRLRVRQAQLGARSRLDR